MPAWRAELWLPPGPSRILLLQEVATIVTVGYLAFYIANAPLGVSGALKRSSGGHSLAAPALPVQQLPQAGHCLAPH